MNVLFAASESAPFIKTGGLGDVIGALPKALQRDGVSVSVVLPKYMDLNSNFTDRLTYLKYFYVPLGWRHQYCGVFYCKEAGIDYYFLDNEYYFKRSGSYGYADDGERFAFFARAVLELLPHLAKKTDLIHCHDWQTGLISVFLRAHYRSNPFYQNMRTLFTIHNLRYQGVFPKSVLGDLLGLDQTYFHKDGLEFYDHVSYMKAGLAYSDLLTTVSPTYAQEIQYPYFGENLDGFLRWNHDKLSGIINGIDQELYNPLTDQALYETYSATQGKQANKQALQSDLGLPVDEATPMIAMITRLTDQKGIDLVLSVFHEIMKLDVQFVLLGTGERNYEDAFKWLAECYPNAVSVNIYFDDSLARKIYAGSDLFLMPSKFEPCGIGQLLAMRYGSLPIVRETGGLNDTVVPYNGFTHEGNGFSFTNYNAHDMLYTIERAIHLFRNNRHVFDELTNRAMGLDFGWDQSANDYLNLYRRIVQ
ncbi:glycogen synthase GlgA [Sporolactobacillus terrae]|uniref:Glycogen synthase n=1 Tax=Sporolactobacillus terrae TaxID=269673 RepID=A0A410D943_9BACL|nr:glycogen synthase GlgA [Sporolactobacillus terrae]QAA22600.1 glycogen synthase GlgA [Sporolactobacillus terrae]QAA25573.1 glycogen synthase GlgA [Sporolactobacillus terrae]UAK17381.1 glycogen synthase GlgA [Sporolactobacillus terrae]BBN98922.1 glycogen synthase [Sporolactobacillus terrae]